MAETHTHTLQIGWFVELLLIDFVLALRLTASIISRFTNQCEISTCHIEIMTKNSNYKWKCLEIALLNSTCWVFGFAQLPLTKN